MTKIRNKELAVAAKMPPLYHSLPGEDYENENSQVLKWISNQPELMSYLYNRAKKANEIIYNPETGKWQGVDYDGEED